MNKNKGKLMISNESVFLNGRQPDKQPSELSGDKNNGGVMPNPLQTPSSNLTSDGNKICRVEFGGPSSPSGANECPSRPYVALHAAACCPDSAHNDQRIRPSEVLECSLLK